MIPYPTVEEASVALGRNLTWFETVWFDYTATRSDFFVYSHTILVLFLVFSLAPLPFVFVGMTGWFDQFKIQPKIKYSLSEMFRCYKDVMKLFLLVVGTLQLVSYPSTKMAGIRSGLPLPTLMELVSQLVVYFLVEDYTNYWIHRWMHCKWGYEKIHRVHHEYTSPIGFASPYAHWAEILILGIPTFLGPAIAPCHIITFWIWITLRQMEAIETHSGYDFPWTPTKWIPFYGGAEYHDYHHYVGGKSQSNFASVFTYCDYLYGTDKLVMLLWSYFSVVVTDPGGVPPGWRPELDVEKSVGNQPLIGEANPSLSVGDSSAHGVRYCRKCNQYKPPRSHHCSVCGRCILKMDHHCVWVVNCVGAMNYKSFLLFLFYTFLETTVVAISLLPVFLVFFRDGDEDITVSPGSLAATFVAFVLNIAFALSVLGFLIMHIMLVARNTTTIEAYEKHMIPNWPYDLGRKTNFEQVFGRDKMYWFVPLYTEDDMKKLPAIRGLDFTCRSESEPLQSV